MAPVVHSALHTVTIKIKTNMTEISCTSLDPSNQEGRAMNEIAEHKGGTTNSIYPNIAVTLIEKLHFSCYLTSLKKYIK